MSRNILLLLLSLWVAVSCAADEGTDADYAARMAREHAGDQPTPGGEDRGIPLDGVRAFESRMHDFDKEVTVHVYEGAYHAFANPSGTRYDEDAAAQA